jgi:hypothetical protein
MVTGVEVEGATVGSGVGGFPERIIGRREITCFRKGWLARESEWVSHFIGWKW